MKRLQHFNMQLKSFKTLQVDDSLQTERQLLTKLFNSLSLEWDGDIYVRSRENVFGFSLSVSQGKTSIVELLSILFLNHFRP